MIYMINLIKMATNQKTFAIIAVLVVLASFGLSNYNTGNATAAVFDFSVTSVSVPAAHSDSPISATAIMRNTGTVSASFISYKYDILNPQGSVVFGTNDKATLFAGKNTIIALPKIGGLPAGNYSVRINLDYNNRFHELDETNNIFVSKEFIVS